MVISAMTKRFLHFILSLLLILNSGCIHTASHETHKLDLESDGSKLTEPTLVNDVKIESLIYTEEKLPLEDFFQGVTQGRFKQAFAKIDLKYYPSNANNKAVKELLSQGLVPVLVKVTNNRKQILKVSEKNFALQQGDKLLTPFDPYDLPNEFAHFSGEAFAANTFNVSVVVLTVIAFLAVSSPGSLNPWYCCARPKSAHSEKIVILNPLEKKIHVDYNRYIFHAQELLPGEFAQGVLFFKSNPSEFKSFQELQFQIETSP